ncbi:bacteriocin [Lactobacillus nasalidis]|uniref:Bacteriocin n=1 Tax=Lactobacillus nasalidis TaxID=2797258 RepID=A0ABQ3W5G6_9LACO|nr:helveticin J family class III bacteriocin [Lactobacillus nasalidis]GHV98367.1 bacteriocin [Lactobacillus nasalidis]GHV99234.1 bacteriocin [Lactobacillus nasalidis]GHW00554.1 bacteriocin [Lactobacillus nasalidis]
MVKFQETTSISLKKTIDLNPHHNSAVQKANVGSAYIYCLQLRNSQEDTYVVRGKTGNMADTILHLSGEAAGHTQTWEYAGIANKWFIGVKKYERKGTNIEWDKQIARVDIKEQRGSHSSHLDFPRLAYLNRAGSHPYSGKEFGRAEAAVSPNHQKFLLVTVDTSGNGYFTIYSLSTINKALDQVASRSDGKNYVNMENVAYLESFYYPNLSGIINSYQGFDMDNYGNIYISSQKAPEYDSDKKKWATHHKQIIKIPANKRSFADQWISVNLSDWGKIDKSGYHSEVEGLQVIGENHVYLTVAYHALNSEGKSVTKFNELYEISW